MITVRRKSKMRLVLLTTTSHLALASHMKFYPWRPDLG